MNKLNALIEAAKAATPGPWDWGLGKAVWEGKEQAALWFKSPENATNKAIFLAKCDPTTILELCALLEKAEKVLEYYAEPEDEGLGIYNQANEILAAIKQWKEQT